MKVQFSDNAFMPGPRAVAETKPAAKDFASELAKASSTKDTDAVKKTADKGKTSTGEVKAKAERENVPVSGKKEKIEDVPGHAYDAIVAGPRNGMMINDSGNKRDGEAFVLVEREGRRFHIYGTGKDRQVFEVGRDDDAKKTTSPKKTTSQTGAAIAGA